VVFEMLKDFGQPLVFDQQLVVALGLLQLFAQSFELFLQNRILQVDEVVLFLLNVSVVELLADIEVFSDQLIFDL